MESSACQGFPDTAEQSGRNGRPALSRGVTGLETVQATLPIGVEPALDAAWRNTEVFGNNLMGSVALGQEDDLARSRRRRSVVVRKVCCNRPSSCGAN